jgi:hypothetical protein
MAVKAIAQVALRGVEAAAPKLAASVEEGALNLLNVIGEKALGEQGWKTTVETALRMGIMPKEVAALARTGELEGQKVGGRWFVSQSSVEEKLNILAERRISDYPFTGRGRALSYKEFRAGLQSYQEEVAARLKLTPAGVEKEWLAPKAYTPNSNQPARLWARELWLDWRRTVRE